MSASLTAAEEQMVTYVPVGHRHTMLIVAFTKYMLAKLKMSDHQRLDLLEKLNSLTDWYFTAPMLATIQPACATQVAMILEARSLDREDDKLGQESFKILTNETVFRHFIGLNPSILEAIKLRARPPASRLFPNG
jgi:hypothetical protein